MAIVPQVPGPVLVQQPVPAFMDTLPKAAIFGDGISGRHAFLDPVRAFTQYFGRVHQAYDMDTTNIENLVKRLLQDPDPDFISFLREETSLKDTFLHRVFKIKTPLGEMLLELESIQERPGRALLSRELMRQAEKEAGELTKKEEALTTEKRGRKQVSSEIPHLLKRQTAGVTKIGPEFQVNTNTTDNQVDPSVASLSNGQFVVTWESYGQDGSGYGVFGQVFNADGTKSGSEFQINTYTTSAQRWSSVASLSNGQFVVTWMSDGQDGNRDGVYGQIFNADGTKSGSEFPVNTYTTDSQRDCSVASLSNDKFVVTWDSMGQDGDLYGIYGQIFNTDGTKSGSEFQVNTYTVNHQFRPSVASLSNGQFVVTWESYGQDGSGYGVFGQVFNADGTKSGSEFQVNTYTVNHQFRPSVASLSNGQFVVTWESQVQDGDGWGVYGQVFNADGTKSGSEFQINTYIAYSQIGSSVASLSNGQFVVTWMSLVQDGDLYGIYGQIFNTDGTKSGSEFQINTYTTSAQRWSSVASLSNEQFVVTWESDGQDGSRYGVFGQIFTTKIPTSSSSSSSSSSTSSIRRSEVVSGAERRAKGIALTMFGLD